ncbi:MAG: murein L,D-transpeptidase catalytic domain-containing protein [Ginsengibacter sp.]
MRIFLKIIFISIAFFISAWYIWYKPKFKETKFSFNKPIKKSSEEYSRLRTKAFSIKTYITANNFNSKICFLVDMKIASGKKRFFVYDLQNDSILFSGLVAHGSCDNGFQFTASFSNKVNSGCSCLGKFKIANSYNGRFGLAYKLYGLDSSNSNTYQRSIVLHSYGCVPEQEVYPLPVCNSRGCPMVSLAFLQILKSYLEKSDKPVLLNVFN